MIYLYLGIVMIITLATTFYVRTIKSKLDTKVDAMFQLVQSMVQEVNQLKQSQPLVSKPKEVIELDINSSNNNKIVVSDRDDGSETYDESSDSDESDDESDDDNDDMNKTVIISHDSPHNVNIQSLSVEPVEVEPVEVEPVEVEVEPVEVEPVEVEPVEVEPVEVEPVEVEPVEVEPVEIEVEPIEVKEISLEPLDSTDQHYEKMTVKELKELVVARGGKTNGKKKNDLIEYLLS